MRFINPKTDYAFKKIFSSSESKDILISFLNALIYNGNSTIEDLEIINPNLPPKVEGLKDTYLEFPRIWTIFRNSTAHLKSPIKPT